MGEQYQQSDRFTKKEDMYELGRLQEDRMVADLKKLSFFQKSFLDDGWICERDGLPSGCRIAICPEMNPAKKNSPFPVDHLIYFFLQSDNTWNIIKKAYGDLKERKAPKYLIENAYKKALKTNPNIPVFPFFKTVGLDTGNEKVGREFTNYEKAALKSGIDIYLIYAVNYDKNTPAWISRNGNGEEYKFPYTNQTLYLTSTLRVREAYKAELLVQTSCTRYPKGRPPYQDYIYQLPFELKLPSGKPLFQPLITNYVIGAG